MSEQVTVQVNAVGNFSQLTGELNKFKSQLQTLKLPKDVMSNVEKAMDNVAEKANKFQLLLSKGIKNKGDYSRLVSGAREYEAAMTQLDRAMDKVGNKEIKAAVFNSSEIKNAEAQLEKLYKQQREIANFGTNKGAKIINESSVAEIQKLIGSTAGLKKKFTAVSDAFKTGNIDQANTAIAALIKHVEQYQSKLNTASQPKRGDNILDWAKKVREYLSTATADVNKFQASFNQLKADKTKQIETSMRNISSATKNATNEMRQQVNAQLQMADSANQMNEQVGHLRTQANYFFGLQNIGRLISRGIREAAESVRDLDKAMTETAVVTDFSVGDMWNMLPEYTKLANELGATTQGAYETMTLYFQQGLDKQATFEIGEETMKMARIAGLDYAQTTNMMTAALRGFNMELNQTSAKRVNDVYSELAAITASDTRELGLAMERTASIAHSAGMDFGNTTAFLAQMIETTREAPENLGTAMKTIIARFQELKENPYAISEVEGEEVDYNRVDKALKSIGVDLMDNKDKFRDLDDVFMDISERWDGLSQTQQRYVATIAAGARQQSRFLAMVQNYDRLKQLTDAAANSEGASDVQFNKTLESYEAKMNKLKNAWQAFTMSLANNHAIKGGIDILKDIITFGNKIIQTFGSVGKIFGETGKGIAEMGAAFGLGALGFKTLKGGANLGLRMLGGMTVKGAAMDGGMFPGGMTSKGSIGLASRISNPIVSAINKLTAVVSKESVDTGFRNRLVQERRGDLYNKARQSEVVSKIPETKLERALSKGNVYHKKSYLPFSAKDIQSEFKDLNNLEQQQLYKSIPSIRNALQDGYIKAYKGLKIDKAGEAALTTHFRKIDQAVQSGKISATDAFKHLYNPQSVAQAIDNPEVTKALNAALQKQMKSWSPERERSMGQKLKYLADKKGLEGEARGQFYRDAKQRFAGKELRETFSGKQTAQLGKVAGAMSKVSGMAAQAGQSVMGLGMMLDSLGMHGAGAAVMTIGNGLVGLGMAAEGAVGAVKALKTAFAALNAINPMLAGLGIIAAIGTATIGAVTAINKKIVKDTRETGERVVKAYTKTKEKTTEQLDNLKKYRENWEVWSAGVDEYGNNINLGTEEYQEYLKAVKDITNAHPELIKGYNALGNAYIDNNTALKKAADLTKKDEKDALNTYLNSYDEIVAKQKTYKRWVNAMSSGGKNAQNTAVMGSTKGAVGRTVNASSTSNMVDQANAVVESIQKISGGEKILKDFNIELDSTGKLTETGLENLRTHLQDVTNAVKTTDLAPSKKTQEQFDNMTEAANTYAKTVQGLEKVSEDTYDWGWAYASKKGYDKIDSNLIVPFQTSIKRLAEQGLSQSEMTSSIDALGSKYQNLGGYLEDFKKIQDKVNEATITLGEDANFDAYTDKVENLTAPIDAWIGSLKDAGGQSNQILAEFFENQVAVMLDYQAQASEILSQGLNQDQNLFTSASQASEKYQKRKEEIVDYTSGIQDAKEILDDAMTSINLEGEGSLTFEQAAISIVGEDFVDRNVNNMDKVKNKMKEYQGWLQDSEGNARSLEDTYTSFWDHITQKAMESPDKTIEGIDGKLSDFFVKTEDGFEMNAEKWSSLTDEQMGLLAEKGFDMSSDFMASMLNIGRQLGYYSSADPSKIRQGLVQQEGQGTAVSQASGRVYKKESDFEEESRLAQNSKSETANLKKEAEKQNVVLLDEAKNLSKSTVKQMMDDFGVSGKDAGKKFAETFSDIGYDKEGVDAALATALKNENLDEGTRKSLEDYRTNLDSNWAKLLEAKAVDFDTEDGTIESIDGHAASIDANTAQLLAKDGALDKNAYGYDPSDKTGEKSGKGYEALQYILGEKGRDTKAQYFASGKDAEGNKLSESTYREWQNQLQNRLSEYQTQAALAKTNAQNATGEDKTWWENQANSYALATQYLQDYITKGQQAHDEKKAQNEEDETSNDEKTRKKTENDQKETESDQTKAENEAQNRQKLSNEYLQYLESLNQMQTGEEGQPTLLTPDQLAQKMGMMTPDEINDYKAKYQELKQLQASSGQVESGDATDIIGNASNLDSTIQKLQQTGTIGTQSADAIKRSFIDANINGIAKMDGSQLASLQSALGITDQELQQIAKEHNITLTTEDSDVDKSEEKVKNLENHPPVKVPVTIGGDEGGDKKPSIFSKIGEWAKEKFKVQTDDSELDSTQQKAETAANFINKGATFTISTPGAGNLTKAAKAAKKLANTKESKTISVKTGKVDTSSVKSAKSAIGESTAKIKVGADTKTALSKAESARKTIDNKSATINVSTSVSGKNVDIYVTKHVTTKTKPHTGGMIAPGGGVIYRRRGGLASNPMFKREGTDTIPAMLTPGEYVQNRKAVDYFGVDFMRKINHRDLKGALQSFGSAAKGRYGKLGPNGNGGLTLTGEEGFEVAWLPSENRSMILGANGPQMINLPNDAVIWNNKESKKIIGQKTISAGSMRSGGAPKKRSSSSSRGSSGSSGGSRGSGTTYSKATSKGKGKNKTYTREIIKAGKINSEIFNLEQKIAQVKIKQEKAQKALNKQLKIAQTTLKDIRTNGNEDIKRLKQSVNLNQELVNKYNKQLQNLDKTGKRTITWSNPTQTKKGKKGKWKKGSDKKHSQSINLGNYIYYDSDTGAFVVDYNKINKAFGKNKNKAKAVQEAAEKEISEKTSKRDSAQSGLDDAQEKLEELGQQLYENFYSWENELTKILEITQKIESAEKQSARLESALKLDSAMAAGFQQLGNALEFFKGKLNSTVKSIRDRTEAIDKEKQAIQNAISVNDEKAALENTKNKINNASIAQNNKNALTNAQKQYDADNAAIKARNNLTKKGITVAKEQKKVNASNKRLSSLQKKKKSQDKKIAKANKVLNNKKASKKAKKTAKKNKATAKKQRKTTNKQINAEKKKRNTAKNNINTINKGNSAAKRIQEDLRKLEAAKAKNANTQGNLLSETELTALKARQAAEEEKLAIAEAAKKYITSKTNADGTIEITIDEKAIEDAKDKGDISTELYEGVKKYYDTLVEENNKLIDLYDDQISALTDLYDTLKDLKEQYADRADELLDSIEDAEEQEVDKLEKLNSSLTNAIKDLLDEVRNKLEERRQQEDNKQKEDEISKKQQRLAALRADTSGGHQVEIAQLEKEIADAQQSYGRSLEDQLLEKLQQQSDEAAKQRERQIDLLSAQLDVDKENGQNIALINQYLSDPERYKNEIYELWKAKEKYDEQTDARKEALDLEWMQFWRDIQPDGLKAKIEATGGAIKEVETDLNALRTALSLLTQQINNTTGELSSPTSTGIGDYAINNESARILKERFGADTEKLKTYGYSAKDLIGNDPNKSAFSATELHEAGFKASELMEGGINNFDTLKEAGYSTSELKEAGFTNINDYINKYSWQDIGKAFSAEEFRKGNVSYANAKSAGYSVGDLKDLYTEGQTEYNNILKQQDKQKKELAYQKKIIAAASNKKIGKDEFLSVQQVANAAGHGARTFMPALAATSGLTWEQVITAAKNAGFSKHSMAKSFDSKAFITGYEKVYGKGTYIKNRNTKDKGQVYSYKTGGLANYTGPAWLDGTPSKPELVLNATDTKNFLALKDVLSHSMDSIGTTSEVYYGDTNVEVNINVDHINNDYDVDKIAERVKKNITKDASYRNVTRVRNLK